MGNPPVIRLEGVSKVYRQNGQESWALREVDLSCGQGEFIALTGPSGSGKTTLLNLIAGLDRPTSGEITVGGYRVSSLSDAEMTRLRRRVVGVVFQSFHLLSHLTVWENVALPLLLRGDPVAEVQEAVSWYLEAVGLSRRQAHRPHELSGGEQQRAAVARGLITRPSVLLADEPTGNLDSETGAAVIQLIGGLSQRQGATVLLVTHSGRAAAHADRTLQIRDGKIEDSTKDSRPGA